MYIFHISNKNAIYIFTSLTKNVKKFNRGEGMPKHLFCEITILSVAIIFDYEGPKFHEKYFRTTSWNVKSKNIFVFCFKES